MRSRFKQIILPLLGIAVVTVLILSFDLKAVFQSYQTESNREIATLIGGLLEESPDLDTSRIVSALRAPSPDSAVVGQAILQKYGYTPADFNSVASDHLCSQLYLHIFVILSLALAVVVIYFCWRDYVRRQRIKELVAYIGNLSERLYDLKLTENSEDDFSLLTNELYKVTVLLKEAAENSRETKQRLETALADISHQLRTPLTSLQIMVDNIYDEPDMSPAVRQDFLRLIGQQIESMSALVATLLNLAKFDNGSIKLRSAPVKISDILEQATSKLAVLADLGDITITKTGDLDAIINLDSRWQTEALSNIIKNCIEHTEAGGNIQLQVSDCPLYLKIIIQDNGEGIAPSDLRHIFDRFYKAKNSSASSIGIGLSFAKAIIESENGQISAQSTLGAGTKFTIIYFK